MNPLVLCGLWGRGVERVSFSHGWLFKWVVEWMYKKVADTQRASTGCLIVSSPEGKSTSTVTTVAPIFPSTWANSLKQDFPACSYNLQTQVASTAMVYHSGRARRPSASHLIVVTNVFLSSGCSCCDCGSEWLCECRLRYS